jgi:hypothetical protein
MRSAHVFRVGVISALLCATTVAQAAGPLLVNGAGQALTWQQSPIPFNPDRGTLGLLSNASALTNVTAAFNVWAAVSTSSVRFANAGTLPVDVTARNYTDYLGVCDDGLSPIVFDTDGTITDDLLGVGSSRVVLGFAGPECGTFVPAVIAEGSAVLNGKFLDGINTAANPEISVSEFAMVFTHEFGHYMNLDHSQIGLEEARDNDPSNDGAIATMFPSVVNPSLQAQLKLDDRVSVSTLYPATSFASAYGTISGGVFGPDGSSPFQGAYVIVRKTDDPRMTAVGVASGFLFFPTKAGGPPAPALKGSYKTAGLPPGSYTVEVQAIDPAFTDGSSVGPLDPPVGLPGPPEYWNGADEAAGNPPDDPAAFVPVVVGAGKSVDNISIILNGTTCVAPVQISKPSIVIGKLNTPPGDDTLVFSGTMTLKVPFDPGLDPSATGMRVDISSQSGSVVDVQLPPGAFDSLLGAGWKVNRSGTKWTYLDKTPAPAAGITKVMVRDQRAQVPGLVKFSVTGKGGSYAVASADLPLDAQVILNQTAGTTTQCGAATFPGPVRKCGFNRLESKLTCK